jgi:probable phosphoglycerate mutase
VTETAQHPPTRIILVRHGQSVANAGGRTADHVSNPLTELGREQSKAFAGRLDCRPTLFIVSPFQRAQQTAEPLRQQYPDVPVEEWPVYEFNFLEPSRHKNSTEDDREPYVRAYWDRLDSTYIDGIDAESFVQFLDRARAAIHRLEANDPGGCVVMFTHGFFMQAFRLALLFPDATDARLMENFRRFHFINMIQNTNSLEFTISGGKIQLVGQPYLTTFKLEGE